MSAFYFGADDRPLFGFHHAPTETARGAVVACPAWGLEYQYSHRALRVLARNLAAIGLHVLRFDYSGTGDSWGETADADLDRWQDDVDLAIREIRAIGRQQPVSLVGLRLGGAVAARAAAARDDVRNLVLWDPILDGQGWVRETQRRAAPKLAGHVLNGRPEEFGGAVVSSTFVEQALAIDPRLVGAGLADHVLLLETQTDTRWQKLASEASVQHEHVPDASPWIEDVSIWSGQIPARAMRRIVEWIEQH